VVASTQLFNSLSPIAQQALQKMILNNNISPVIQSEEMREAKSLTTTRNNYKVIDNSVYLDNVESRKGAHAFERNITIDRYDEYGKPVQYTKRDGIVTTVLWGYGSSYPVAKIEGADYATVAAKVDPAVIRTLSDDNALSTSLAPLRTIPVALATTYTYSPLIGITSETDPSGKTTYYVYDSLGRLSMIKDKDGNIIKTYDYHYKGQ
jgi:YD repeat-containing protein